MEQGRLANEAKNQENLLLLPKNRPHPRQIFSPAHFLRI